MDDPKTTTEVPVLIRAPRVALPGLMALPGGHAGVIVFACASDSTSDTDRHVACELAYAGFATLRFDLLTAAEQAAERATRLVRFDARLLADRLVGALDWVRAQSQVPALPIGVFAQSSGAAAALIAATRDRQISAIVSAGGRPDLATDALPYVRCPTLLVAGGNDPEVIERNHRAIQRLDGPAKLHTICGAGHRFEEAGAVAELTRVAIAWFREHLGLDGRVEDTGFDTTGNFHLNEHAIVTRAGEPVWKRDDASGRGRR